MGSGCAGSRTVSFDLRDRVARAGPTQLSATDLTHLHQLAILMHMRTTLNIDEALLREAQRLSGFKEKTAVLRAGLEALIARESARRLAALGGSDRRLRPIPRRRPGRR